MEKERPMLETQDLNTVVDFISACQRIEDPQPDDVCSLLRRLRDYKVRSLALGLCRLNKQHAEFTRTMGISGECLQQQAEPCAAPVEACDKGAGGEPPQEQSIGTASLSCQPKRFAPMDAIDGGFVFCQSSHLGPAYASCLFLEEQAESLSPETKAVLELVIPHLLHLVEDLHEADSALSRLTEREKEVLKWVAAGKSNWEIGRILRISERTTKYHISNILSKLNISNRVQAAAFASLVGSPAP